MQTRFTRHMYEAASNVLDTKFARAIRKYGKKNFQIELIEEVKTKEELDTREVYWIRYYDSCNNGYNSTESTCGGNTYKGLDNLDEVKKKLSDSKMGAKNPRARGVIVTNTETEESSIYGSMCEAARELNISSHVPISRRCKDKNYRLVEGIYECDYYNK